MNKINSKRIEAIAAGLLFPVASFIHSLFHPQSKNYLVIIVLFFCYVGMSLQYDNADSSDVYEYVRQFESVHSMKDISFHDYFIGVSEKQQVDYYSSFMWWFISRFTGEPRIYLGIMALVTALFFAANLSFIRKHIQFNKRIVLLLAVLLFTPSMSLLTHRWWTALQIFIFGFLNVIVEKKYTRIIWCFIAAVIVHFSFIYPLIILIISLLLPKRHLTPYLIVYVVFSLIQTFDFNGAFSYISAFLPELIGDRTFNYINAEEQYHNFFSQTGKLSISIANMIILIGLYGSETRSKENKQLVSLYSIALLMGAFSAMAALTEWGWRYLELSNMLFLILYMFSLSGNSQLSKNKEIFNVAMPFIVYFLLFKIRGFLAMFGLYSFVGNYITLWFTNDTISIWDWIF